MVPSAGSGLAGLAALDHERMTSPASSPPSAAPCPLTTDTTITPDGGSSGAKADTAHED
jgi:hypothetical protein